MGEIRNAYKTLVLNLERKKPLGRSRRRCEDNIKIDLTKTGLEDVFWIHVDEVRSRWQALVNRVIALWYRQIWEIIDLLSVMQPSQDRMYFMKLRG
jgi:hypothetical protein